MKTEHDDKRYQHWVMSCLFSLLFPYVFLITLQQAHMGTYSDHLCWEHWWEHHATMSAVKVNECKMTSTGMVHSSVVWIALIIIIGQAL